MYCKTLKEHRTDSTRVDYRNRKKNKVLGIRYLQESPIRLSVDFSAETLQARSSKIIYLEWLKSKTFNLEFYIQQNCSSKMREK